MVDGDAQGPGRSDRRARRFSRAWRAAALVAALACGGTRASSASAAGAEDPGAPLFADGSAAAGLSVAYANGARGRFELLAIMGPGAALFDYDGDGDLDLFLPQGGTLPGDAPAGTTATGGGHLLRNDLGAGPNGQLVARFVDVTARAGLRTRGYGVGAAVGDVDGDGNPELLVTAIGADELWRNRGDGTFAAATPPALARPGWSVSAAFFDAHGDGRLDLYVADYVEPVPGVSCYAESSRPDYCGPAAYHPLPDRLLRAGGDLPGGAEDVAGTGPVADRSAGEGGPASARGVEPVPAASGGDRSPGSLVWTDASVVAGIARAVSPGLGVIAADFDGDGRADLYVANDGAPNLLWRQRADGGFREDSLLSGTALSRDGLPQAGMGIDIGDVDGDGDEDLFVTNLTGETNALYVNQGEGTFEDRSAEAGLAAGSLPWTGFGTAFVDANLDGWLDLVVVNGAVRLASPQATLAQPGQLYRNLGGGLFTLAPPEVAGVALATPRVARGLAVGDVDEDGDADAVVAVNDGPAALLLGEPPRAAGWVGVAPCPGVADAGWLAWRVAVEPTPGHAAAARAAPPERVRRPHRDGSYASARDPRVVVGLGEAPAAAVELRGTTGTLRWRQPPSRAYLLWCPAEGR